MGLISVAPLTILSSLLRQFLEQTALLPMVAAPGQVQDQLLVVLTAPTMMASPSALELCLPVSFQRTGVAQASFNLPLAHVPTRVVRPTVWLFRVEDNLRCESLAPIWRSSVTLKPLHLFATVRIMLRPRPPRPPPLRAVLLRSAPNAHRLL